jgi:hypothetical protein
MDFFAIIGAKPARGSVRSLKLARLVDGTLTPCGWLGSGLTEAEGTKIRVATNARRALVAEVEYRGFTPAGELRHPVLRRRASSVRPSSARLAAMIHRRALPRPTEIPRDHSALEQGFMLPTPQRSLVESHLAGSDHIGSR